MRRPTMTKQVEEYLTLRRAMGFDLVGEGYQLHAFARFVEETGHAGPLTTDLLLRWVQAAKKPGPVTASRRVEVLRPFLKYCRQFDPVCPVLPLGLCGPAHRRIPPHIYTEAEIIELLVAARELKPDGMRPLTYVTLLGTLAATGMRLSEALHLEQSDVNLKQSTLTVRETKFKKSRLVPLHSSTIEALIRESLRRNISATQRQSVLPHQRRPVCSPENGSLHLRCFASTVRLDCARRTSTTKNP